MKNNYLISTGGSGGHVIPATILYEHLSKKAGVIISTDKRGSRYIDKDIYQFKIINTPKLNNILFLPFGVIKIFFLIIKSFFLLRTEKITKLVSTGGYMSLPLILAGKLLGLKIYLFEPNLVLGRANKYFLNSCYKIFCYTDKIKNFPDNLKNKIVTINPLVRKEIYKTNNSSEKKDKFNLLVVGGSQGASIFDNNLKNSIVNISKKFPIKIFQQTSKKNVTYLKDFYSKNNIENIIFSFDKNFVNIIHKADLCITRAGASTLAELSVLNKPFIAVPLPSSKDNHQLENANFYKDNDSCWVLNQVFFEDKIEEVLNDIFNNKTDYLKKKNNLKRLNYQNTWINVNQKILRNIDEN
jgi:UDP-N-acetylglucosamine--N-acetylmuramyl-(pentapeptide) pyrophosphoryl-undecaprenol N-acetylglucosamine transferase